MAKVSLREMPTIDEIQKNSADLFPADEFSVLYTTKLFRRVADEMEGRMESVLAEYHLTMGRYTLLTVLRKQPEGLMPSELSNMVGVTQATISGLINSLEKAGLAVREAHVNDGRSFKVKITDKGRETIKEIVPKIRPHMRSFWTPFSEEEIQTLNTFFQRMMVGAGVE